MSSVLVRIFEVCAVAMAICVILMVAWIWIYNVTAEVV